MDADSDDSEYALRPPATHRRETITHQLQREILGEMAGDRAQEEPLDASHQQEQKSEEDEPPSTPSKRHTLSPGKAIQLPSNAEALDAAISRRDTVSPEALKAVMRSGGGLEKIAQKKSSPVQTRNSLETSELLNVEKDMLGNPPARRKGSEEIPDSPARSTRSKTSSASKRPRSATKQTSPTKPVEDPRKSTSVVNSSDSFTDSMFAPNLLEQDAVRRPTLDTTEAARVVVALRIEERRLSSSALEMDVDSDDAEQPSKQINSSKTSTPSKESKQSPSSVKDSTNSRKTPTPSKDSSSRKSPAKETRKSPSLAKETPTSKQSKQSSLIAKDSVNSRKSPSPEKKAKGRRSPTPSKSSSKRRATVDPSDVFSTLPNSPQQEEDHRQAIDDNGLLILNNSLATGGNHAADKWGEEASRKRANDSDERKRSPGKKRARINSDHNDATAEYLDVDSPRHPETESSPSTKEDKPSGSSQNSPDELPPSQIPKHSLFSPLPRLRTPLKGILSARKDRRNAETTPTKSVNFGPSQGAEFNHGSPSTSMTPMLAKDASRLFPLERVSSEEEPDDAETSLNSSILDEADSLDEEEPKQVSVRKVTQIKKPGFDLLQSRRSSLMAPKSTDKDQRRHSMRGFSPLDSRAEIRRRRRQTINVTRQASTTTSSTAEKPTSSSQSPSAVRNNSFLRATDVVQTTLMPYADSSASSDAGEDMEITGDYSITLGSGKQSQSFTGLPRDEDTAEFSLGHLLAESSVYELTKSAPESDLHDLPGSLGDLANEVASQSNHTELSSDQDATLDPIQEANETMTSSRNQSAMSLVSDDSDDEYAAKRASLQVNLKAQFDRVSEPSQSPRHPPTPESSSIPLITMEELLSSVLLNEESTLVEAAGAFFGEDTESSDGQVSKDVMLACAHDTCSAVIERHSQDVTSWSSAVTEELSSLLHVKAPAVFSPENLDDACREAIQELFATEALVARTGWCQLQTQIEKQLTSSLSLGADALSNDVKSLKDSVAADVLKRQNELAAIREMIDREEQMALLLDAIEEQQGAHDEYVKAVKDLEKECSSLSLEESVLQSRLKVLQGRAAELEPVTSEAATLFGQEVLATEEMLAILESMSVWKIREATASILRLSARFEDLLFDVEICVDVHLGPPSTGGASTSIKTKESLKRREGNTYLPYEKDVVLVLQRLLLDPHYISRIADESELGDGLDGRICSKLQVLENFVSRSFRLLKELRELSTHFSMRYDEDDSNLWVDFLKFPSAASRINVEGAQFSVGFSLLPVFPFTDYQTAVQVPHGKVSTDAVAKEIELVSRQEPKYFTRVCRRLHESFAR